MKELEIWKSVLHTNGKYEVSNLGRVRSNARGKCQVLAQNINSRGYRLVHIYYELGIGTSKTVHSLVLDAFMGERPGPEYDANHKNGDRLDNRLENLEWITHAENVRHGKFVLEHFPLTDGENNGRSILNWEQVREIRSICSSPQKRTKSHFRELAKKYSVRPWTISDVVYGYSWKE